MIRAGVIGWPVTHSRSPAIHLAAAAALGVDLEYRRFPVAPGSVAAAIRGARASGLRGLSVTMPHKEAVIEHLDEVSDVAAALRAVNCITFGPDGRTLGDNTDGAGFLLGLEHDSGSGVEGCHVAVLGAGGAARAVIHACGGAGADRISVVARRPEAAIDAAHLAPAVAEANLASAVHDADVIVNATPVGMADTPYAGELACSVAALGPDTRVVDLIYNPLVTPLLAASSDLGLRSYGGLSMLAGQAAAQFAHWTGVDAPLDVMFAAAAAG